MFARTNRLLVVIGAAAAVLACDDSNGPDGPNILGLQFLGLEALSGGFHYEGWAIINGAPVSTGKFNVNATGAVVTPAGALITNGEFRTNLDLSTASNIVITIEPNGDVDALPAQTKILAGPVANSTAALAISQPQALGNNFQSARGKFVLATPTDAVASNDASGVWFLDNSSGTPMASLVLPTLPAGWKYEGWAVINARPVTTGRFTRASGADESAPFSGPLPGPPFPGEDFLRNAPAGLTFPTDLRGGMAVISIEPDPDDSPNPFTLKPLVATIAANAPLGTVIDLTLNPAAPPTGTARIR